MKLAAAKRIKAYLSLLTNSYVLPNCLNILNVSAGREEFDHTWDHLAWAK